MPSVKNKINSYFSNYAAFRLLCLQNALVIYKTCIFSMFAVYYKY